MSARFVMISRYMTTESRERDLMSKLTHGPDRRILKSVEKSEVIEIRALDGRTSLVDLTTEAPLIGNSDFAELLIGDVQREILVLVEALKDSPEIIPTTRYIQLRHVEVKPHMMSKYLEWRNKTIFNVVREHNPVEAFLAYHSLVSNVPGVMFISGFNSSIEQYTAAFTDERYSKIVQEAGDTYITGGTQGLYTEVYEA